jgi:glycosyltransferase involved in cell wall biosynthesis
LIEEMAARRPEWSFVMIGPLAKIAEADLATGPNIHYLGKRAYEELPAYLAAFDVAIMPFARNESTRFISPTKTLEYLAGGKPIVSTPIEDVVTLYGEVVEIAEDAGAFVGYIEAHLGASPEEVDRRNRLAETILARHEWDRIARGMSRLMHETIYEKRTTTARISNRVPFGRVSRSPVAVGAEMAGD